MSNTEYGPPAPPDPLKLAQWAGQIRALLPLVGGALAAFGVTLPTLTEAQISGYISAAMTVAGLAMYGATAFWSWRSKLAAERAARDREVDAAVASARATKATGVPTPVTVTVTELTPAGVPNEGVAHRIGRAEERLAAEVTNLPPQPAPDFVAQPKA